MGHDSSGRGLLDSYKDPPKLAEGYMLPGLLGILHDMR